MIRLLLRFPWLAGFISLLTLVQWYLLWSEIHPMLMPWARVVLRAVITSPFLYMDILLGLVAAALTYRERRALFIANERQRKA